jgi:hypothetical protein
MRIPTYIHRPIRIIHPGANDTSLIDYHAADWSFACFQRFFSLIRTSVKIRQTSFRLKYHCKGLFHEILSRFIMFSQGLENLRGLHYLKHPTTSQVSRFNIDVIIRGSQLQSCQILASGNGQPV